MCAPVQVRRSAIVAVQKQSHPFVGKTEAERVAGKSPLVRSILRIPGEVHVLGKANIVVCCVCEQRLQARRLAGIASAQEGTRPLVQMAGIATAFAAEQVISVFLLRSEGCLARKVV